MQFKVLLFLCICWRFVDAYKILVAIPSAWSSHYKFGSEIAKALAAESHEVTVISPFKQPKPIPNYEEIYIEFEEQEKITRKFPFTIMKFLPNSDVSQFRFQNMIEICKRTTVHGLVLSKSQKEPVQ